MQRNVPARDGGGPGSPSARSTSQSMVTVFSPKAAMSVTDRRARPVRRWISWVLPDGRPLATSLRTRSSVDLGSIAYSAVTHPMPLPLRQRGTPGDTVAVQMTCVSPISINADPSALGMNPGVIFTGRVCSAVRPSARVACSSGSGRDGCNGSRVGGMGYRFL